jgi:hypothetical protein
MTRWKAAGIHLLLSTLIIGAIGIGLLFVWYGPALFTLTGGLKLLVILAICDVLIGPLLTLIVFKSGKKSLKFDLTVIAILQAAFLVYGLNVMRESRPIFLVAVLDRFELVFSSELSDEDLAKGGKQEFRTRSLTGPQLVGGIVARDKKEELDLALSGFAGRDVQLMPDRYTAYADVAHDLALKARPVAELAEIVTPAERERLMAAVSATKRDQHSVGFLPITSRWGRATMLIELGTGEVLAPVAVDPWPDLRGK